MPRHFDLSRLLLRLAAFVLLAVLAASILARWPGLRAGDIPVPFVWYYLVPLAISAAGLFGLSFAGRDTRIVSILCLGAGLVALYGVEFYLQYQRLNPRSRVEDAAKHFGNPFDPRTVDEVVADLRKQGVNAHPFMRILNRHGPLMPLANTPNRTIVWCNEVGPYLIFKSDRHGFNNPDAIWDQAPVELAVVGDSYVQGACAPKNDGMVDRVRAKLPSVVNLGIGGNAPQSNLATLVEYAPVVRPKRIVWVHYAGNDLSGMMQDENNPRLRWYVEDPNFTQHLAERRAEIAGMMDDFFNTEYGGTNRYEMTPLQAILKRPLLFLKFTSVRQGLGITNWEGDSVDFGIVSRTFARTKALADALNAPVTVISLPHVLQAGRDLEAPERRVRDIVTGFGMTYVDAGAEMRKRGDPASFYAFGSYGGHLSDAGNALLAELILQAAGR